LGGPAEAGSKDQKKMSGRILIGGREVSDDAPCYVIAEIGGNHQGEIEKAIEMIRVAKQCGADAVKFQKRNNRELYTKAFYDRPYDHRNSYGPTYGLHREALELDEKQFGEVVACARDVGITLFSTPFDVHSADFLEKFNPPAYKIASGDIRTLPLIRHVASFGKPVLISTGGATLDDVRRASEATLRVNRHLCLLQCTSAYPAEFSELNLRVIETYRREFPEAVIGLSSHDNGIAMALVGWALGARVIEKHFTLNRALKGTDHAISLEPAGLRKLVRDLRRADSAMGDGIKRVYDSELDPITKMGKKLVAARPLSVGTVLSVSDIAVKCPADGGLPPYRLDELIGKVVTRDLEEDENITFEVVRVATA